MSVREELIGTWALVAYERGSPQSPLSLLAGTAGRLHYGPQEMWVLLLDHNVEPRRVSSYTGTWDADEDRVVHHIQFSSLERHRTLPLSESRTIRWRSSDCLVLETTIEGLLHRVSWARLGEAR